MITTTKIPRLYDSHDASFTNSYWVDVDVALKGIIRHQLPGPLRLSGPQPLPLLKSCVLEGVGAVGFAPSEAMVADKHLFAVRIARNAEDAASSGFDRDDDCRVMWDKRGDRSWRSTIYISDFILRHIVEFFVTKRIDSIRLSIQVSKWRNAPNMSADSFGSIGSESEFQSDNHTRCRLLAVVTSKGRIYPP